MSIPYTKNDGVQAVFEKKHAFSETFFELGGIGVHAKVVRVVAWESKL